LLEVADWLMPEEIKVSENKVFSHLQSVISNNYLNKTSSETKTDSEKWPLRVALFGKPYSGFEKLAAQMAEKHPLVVINADLVLQDAIDAFQAHETVVHKLTEKEATGKFELVQDSQFSTPS
jgi:hypothetical protein